MLSIVNDYREISWIKNILNVTLETQAKKIYIVLKYYVYRK